MAPSHEAKPRRALQLGWSPVVPLHSALRSCCQVLAAMAASEQTPLAIPLGHSAAQARIETRDFSPHPHSCRLPGLKRAHDVPPGALAVCTG